MKIQYFKLINFIVFKNLFKTLKNLKKNSMISLLLKTLVNIIISDKYLKYFRKN